jgi:hypothetical protein
VDVVPHHRAVAIDADYVTSSGRVEESGDYSLSASGYLSGAICIGNTHNMTINAVKIPVKLYVMLTGQLHNPI